MIFNIFNGNLKGLLVRLYKTIKDMIIVYDNIMDINDCQTGNEKIFTFIEMTYESSRFLDLPLEYVMKFMHGIEIIKLSMVCKELSTLLTQATFSKRFESLTQLKYIHLTCTDPGMINKCLSEPIMFFRLVDQLGKSGELPCFLFSTSLGDSTSPTPFPVVGTVEISGRSFRAFSKYNPVVMVAASIAALLNPQLRKSVKPLQTILPGIALHYSTFGTLNNGGRGFRGRDNLECVTLTGEDIRDRVEGGGEVGIKKIEEMKRIIAINRPMTVEPPRLSLHLT